MLNNNLHITSSNNHVDYAILSAMPEELEFFREAFQAYTCESIILNHFKFDIYNYQGKRILLTNTGIGTTFTAGLLTFIYHHFNPEYIIFSGTAGGIKPGLKINDVVIVEQAFEAENYCLEQLKGTPFESCLIHPLKNECFPLIYSANNTLLEIANNIDYGDNRVYKGIAVSSNAFPAPEYL